MTIALVLTFLQARPVPVQGGNEGGGTALIFLLLAGLVFLFCAAALTAIFAGVLRHLNAPDSVDATAVIPACIIAGVGLWLYWDDLSPVLANVAEYSWIVLLIVFLAVLVAAVIAVLVSSTRSAFSRENVGGTLSIIAIAGSTAYLCKFEGWNFWPALGVSFGGIFVLSTVIVLVLRSIGSREREQ